MKSFLYLLLTLILIASTLLMDILARHFYLYWTTDWVNLFVHFLGGTSLGFLLIWFFRFSGLFKDLKLDHRKLSNIFLLCILFVGLMWELYEYRSGLTFYSAAFVFDTIADLSMDLCGGLLAYTIAERFKI